MAKSERRILIEAVHTVVQGGTVDWDRLADTHPGLRGHFRTLRSLAPLVEVDRDLEEDVLAPGTSWGPLEIRRRVGQGSFGDVYSAYDPVLQREVALKIHRDGDTKLQLDEARRLARVRHPNVLAIHGIEIHDGRVGMWTDFVEGRTLEEVVTKGEPLSEAEIVRIGSAVCGALAAVHDAGLIHADLKAANVMLGHDARPLVMDFGAGRENVAAPSDGVARPAFGTPLVMAPEILRGGSPTVASDLYAVGVLLYLLATGRYPIEAATRNELLERLGTRAIPPLGEIRPDLGADVVHVIMDALEPEPGSRPASSTAFATRLAGSDDARATDFGAPSDTPFAALPVYDTRFVGRRAEIRELRQCLQRGGWVTLVGPGGSGKTRLAHEVVRRTVGAHPGGGAWVDLYGVRDAEALDIEVCRVMDLDVRGFPSPRHGIVDRLAGAAMLIVLDNAEHLVEPTRSFIEHVLGRCERTTILCTSRARLAGEGEVAFDLEPLALPSAEAASIGEILESEAARLFVVRASSTRHSFRLTNANAQDVVRICRRVDGIPLGIELAAARTASLGEAELADRLDRSLVLLRDRVGSQVPRHASIRALIEWSVGLLSDPARTLLARLSVFAGTFTLLGAEHVCADGEVDATSVVESGERWPPEPLSPKREPFINGEEIADLLADLVEHSLIAFEPGEAPRYRMLGLIRGVAAERLLGNSPRSKGMATDGETHRLAWRHHDWYRDLARHAHVELRGQTAGSWLVRLEAEVENIQSALDLPSTTERETISRLTFLASLQRWWLLRGRFHEGIRRLRQVDALPKVEGEGSTRASVHHGLGNLLADIGRFDEARAEFDRCIHLNTEAGEDTRAAVARADLGGVLATAGDLEGARRVLIEARDEFRRIGHHRGLASSIMSLGFCQERSGDDEGAMALYAEALAIERSAGSDRLVLIGCLNNLAGSLLRLRRAPDALPVAEEGIELLRDLRDEAQLAASLVTYGSILLAVERPGDARCALLEAARIHEEIDYPWGIVHMAATFGLYFLTIGNADAAALAFGFCRGCAQRLRVGLSKPDELDMSKRSERLRVTLGDARFAEIEAASRTMSGKAFAARVQELASAS
jgi:non-specific serine/threonine protein kinase